MMSLDDRNIEHAFDMRHFVPFVQPMVDLRVGRIAGFEMLVRWMHPSKGLLLPEKFVGLIQDGSFSWKVTEAMLSQTCRAAAGWPDHLFLSVGLSDSQLQEGIERRIATTAARAGFPMNRLIIAINGATIGRDFHRTRKVAEEIRRLGARISLDDFGTSQSDLAHARGLPLDQIRLDAGLTEAMTHGHSGWLVVANVLELGRSLGLSTVGKGIGKEAQLDMLGLLNCDVGQGELLGTPTRLEVAQTRTADPDWNVVTGFPTLSAMPNADLSFSTLWGLKETLELRSRGSRNIGLCTFDQDRRYRKVNKMLADINGRLITAHLGHVVGDILPSHRAVAVNAYLERVLSGEEGIKYEIEKRADHAASAHFLVSLEPIRDRRNTVTGVACVMENMTKP